MEALEGSCHCGALRFRVQVEERRALECNCSICFRKGFMHVIVPRERFELLTSDEGVKTYTFGTHTAKHLFCGTCGVSPFYFPRSHPEGVSANLRCLDPDVVETFRIEGFDGRNWEENVGKIQ